MIIIESIGIIGTVAILISMCFKTSSFKAALWLRILNLAGSVLFVVYGALLPAISTAVLNGCLIVVNGFHIYLLIRDEKKKRISEKDDKNIKKDEKNEEKSEKSE